MYDFTQFLHPVLPQEASVGLGAFPWVTLHLVCLGRGGLCGALSMVMDHDLSVCWGPQRCFIFLIVQVSVVGYVSLVTL